MMRSMRCAWVLALLGLAHCGGGGDPGVVTDAGNGKLDAGPSDTGPSDTGFDVPPSIDNPPIDNPPADTGSTDAAPSDVARDGSPSGCRDNTDCAANEFGFRVCNTATATCVPCTAGNRGSCMTGQYCTSANRCEAGCSADSDCVEAGTDGGVMRCDTAQHVCVGCASDSHCAPGTVCVMSACRPGCNASHACPTGEACCAEQCRRTQSDLANCGACGRACTVANATAACTAGSCTVEGCNPGFGNCDGDAANGCETGTLTSAAHCGQCGTVCPGGPNATAVCSAGRCGLTCAAGFGDCDGMAANGCETNLQNATGHCGQCGTVCSAGANATAACVAGRCGVSCSAGFGDCNNNPGDGCEANLQSDPSRCGTCVTMCAGGTNAAPRCASGICGIACAPGFADCDGNSGNGCEASLSGLASCGGCGNACTGATPFCSRTGDTFACSSGCTGSQTRCSNVCTDPQTDRSNCGACGTVCPPAAGATAQCAAGRCGFSCNTGLADCDANPVNGCEVATETSVRHCGVCDNACPAPANATATCVAGACGTHCTVGFASCDGNAANGCEANTQNSTAHCGQCGTACTAGQVCLSGRCGQCTADAQCPSGQRCAGGACTTFACNVGTGSDGDFRASADRTLNAATYNFRSFVIDPGVIVTVVGANPLVLQVLTEARIAGVLRLDGQTPPALTRDTPLCAASSNGPTNGGAGGGGGGNAGGNGGACYVAGSVGNGPGAGQPGSAPGGGAGGAGYGTTGQSGGGPSACGGMVSGTAGTGGASYGAPMFTSLVGGSGGGGGGAHGGCNSGGAGGGGGGGAVRITALRLVIPVGGRISANGGDGGSVSGRRVDNACDLDGGGGGGGSGGTIWLQAADLQLDGSVQSRAGAGGTAAGCSDGQTGMNGGAGGPGRVRLDVGARTGTGTIDPAPGATTPGC